MTRISVYDDTAEVIDTLCDKFDLTEPELIEMLIDEAASINKDIMWYIKHPNS